MYWKEVVVKTVCKYPTYSENKVKQSYVAVKIVENLYVLLKTFDSETKLWCKILLVKFY